MKTHRGPECDHSGSSLADRQVGKALLAARGPATAIRVLVKGGVGPVNLRTEDLRLSISTRSV